MHNSVVCAEDVPFYDTAAIDRAQLAQTFLGTAQVDTLHHDLPHAGRAARWMRISTRRFSDVPALLLSGSDDPVTPPAVRRAGGGGLRARLHVVLAGLGHGQLGAPCVDA